MSSTPLIREAATKDHARIISVVHAAFTPEPVDGIVDVLWKDNALVHEVVSENEGDITGYCGFSRIEMTPTVEGKLLQLSPVAISPAHQRRGIGKTLVAQAIENCRLAGADVIAVLGDPGYYGQFGFKPAKPRNITWEDRETGNALQFIDFTDSLDNTPRQIHMHPAFSEG